MMIDGEVSTSGTVVLQLGETAEIDVPGGRLGVRVEWDGGSPELSAVGTVVTLRNFHGALGMSATCGYGLPGRPALNLRFRVTSDDEGAVRAVQYTAVATG